MQKISIMIADDHKLIRETWSYILNNDPRFEVIAECGDSEESVEMARQKRPQIILMDINMTPISGFEATEKIRKVSPASRIIGVSMHSQPAYAKKMLQIGARGYVTKNSSKEEMIKAILEVQNGNKYICDEIKNNISELVLEENKDTPNVNALTEREIQIINLIKEGLSSKEIATQLNISLKTVEVHRHNILKKLKLKNSASLVNFINNTATYI
jgi:DNA-binding NarL/FixJ family response regulator